MIFNNKQLPKNIKKGFKALGGVLLGVVAVAAAPITGTAMVVTGIAAGLTGGVLGSGVLFDKKPKVKKGVFIMGPQLVGKSEIYKHLQRSTKEATQTSVSGYEEFDYQLGNKESITIKKGKDVGGGEEYISRFYKKILQDKEVDYILFVFNVYKYINNIDDHKGDVNARLDFIHKNNSLKKNIVCIGSFIDKFKNEDKENIYKRISKLTTKKDYKVLVSKENFQLLNLTDNESLIVFFNKLFKV
jgi:hypothetical protein